MQTYPLLAASLAIMLPFAGFLLSAICGKRSKNGVIAIITISLSLLAAGYTFTQVWDNAPLHVQWHWFTIGQQAFHVGIWLDNMAVLMLLLVPLVALPVHIYSVAYMKGDPGLHRYWMYLSLFCFAMLGLVAADNLLLMYCCWELVGFASYLLIGFWFTKDAAAQASKKAFIINRIGDAGFLIGIAIVYSGFGTVDIQALFGPQGLLAQSTVAGGQWLVPSISMPAVWLTVAGLAFFLGAMAKSAQFPLHVWLPDAMEGPTSISSLIHAATMVAAGVFLLVRVFPVFNETTLMVIAGVGTLTAFIAAYFALTQCDIKRILAFSTISQLGFMMVGVGIGMSHVSLFHLVTHAFFKCLLFLCAGAIIHEMQHLNQKHQLTIDPQDIRNMGGLGKYMPITCATMLIAALALTGFPLTAGYLSKDALLVHAFEWGALQQGAAKIIPYMLVIVSVLTSFYIFRLLFKVFFASPAYKQPIGMNVKIKEASWWLLAPMLFLAACSLFPFFTVNPLNDGEVWLLQGIAPLPTLPPLRLLHLAIPILTTLTTLLVVVVTWHWYTLGKYPLKTGGFFYRLSVHQGYMDAFYHVTAVQPILKLSRVLVWVDRQLVDGLVNGVAALGRTTATLAGWIDRHVVDGVVNLIGKIAWGMGNVLRRSQTGRVQYYFFVLFFIILVVLLYHIIVQA
ncbi:NADH-quinone oxidoreductase subunit 5 family protein [Parapedobacter tibetensis]|uniref:NADH-quinone oxidoreductase subunit 5 family protein n=1 Tax=Parapedobacter tibetensis TaxID=2972951 RepID=UPI00214D355E|nr:NADH-quinone oxidoreductase subunit L [Parapedobacter tibetensis]